MSTTPTSMDTGYKTPNATYNRQFWSNACGYTVFQAWSSPGGTHSMPYEEAEILKFFGLDTTGGTDPEPDCPGGADGGVTGTGGAAGNGGSGGVGGAVGAGGGAGAPGTGGTAGTIGGKGTGGSIGSGGSTGSGGTDARGGNSGSGGGAGTGGAVGSGGSSAEGGSGGTGGAQGSGGSVGSGGSSGTGSGGSGPMQDDTSSSGCSCAVGSDARHSASVVTPLLLAAFGLIVRRRQGRPRRPSR